MREIYRWKLSANLTEKFFYNSSRSPSAGVHAMETLHKNSYLNIYRDMETNLRVMQDWS